MGLEKLVFVYPDVTVELGTNLQQPKGDDSPFFLVEANLKFPSGNERKGFLVYDADKRIFITALTDLWEHPVDWNSPDCDLKMVGRCSDYKQELSETMSTLLRYGVVKYVHNMPRKNCQ